MRKQRKAWQGCAEGDWLCWWALGKRNGEEAEAPPPARRAAFWPILRKKKAKKTNPEKRKRGNPLPRRISIQDLSVTGSFW